jgi:hypothetical protein
MDVTNEQSEGVSHWKSRGSSHGEAGGTSGSYPQPEPTRMSGVVPLSQAVEQMNDYARLPDSQYDSATHDSSGYQNE